jgi:tRNA threonylcarbamoyladenosine biosynthesis protein TsaE
MSRIKERVIGDLEELATLANEALERLRERQAKNSATVLALSGEFGAGKTAFTQALARRLGVEGVVASPTYVIMKRYRTADPDFPTLVHVDAYRIESPAELLPLRFSAVLAEPRALVCIEWAEKLAAELPPQHLTVSLAHLGDSNGPRRVLTNW